MLVEEVLDAGDEVLARVAPVDGVVAVGVEVHVELVAELHECLGEFGGVLEVDVVVGHSVDEEEVAVDFLVAVERRAVVAGGILLRCAHESLGIDGVVESPVGDGGNGYATVEDFTAFAHGHEGVESAEAPSPDGDACLVHVGELAEPDGGLDLVARFEVAEFHVGASLEVGAPAAGAASIDADDDVALLGQMLLPHESAEESVVEGVEDHLIAGAAVLIHDDGVLPGGVKVAGLDHPAVELDAVGGVDGDEFGRAEGQVGEPILEVGIVLDGLERLARGVAERIDGRCGQVGVGVEIVLASVAEHGLVPAFLRGELGLLARGIDLVDVLLERTSLVAGVVEVLARCVGAVVFRHFVIARRELTDQLTARECRDTCADVRRAR